VIGIKHKFLETVNTIIGIALFLMKCYVGQLVGHHSLCQQFNRFFFGDVWGATYPGEISKNIGQLREYYYHYCYCSTYAVVT